jgi:hypothetical protein
MLSKYFGTSTRLGHRKEMGIITKKQKLSLERAIRKGLFEMENVIQNDGPAANTYLFAVLRFYISNNLMAPR